MDKEAWSLPDLRVPGYLLNAQEPDILSYDLLRGELEGKDSGDEGCLPEGCRRGQGWEGKPGTCGTLGPTEHMVKGTLHSLIPISLQLEVPGPMGAPWGPHGHAHTEKRSFFPGIIVRTGREHAL